MAHGSFLRRDGKPLIHALSKFFTVIDYDGNNRTIQFKGQPLVQLQLASDKKSGTIILNGEKQKPNYNSETQMLELNLNTIK